MSSKRDMLRKMNQKNNSRQEKRTDTLVTELVDNYEKKEEKESISDTSDKTAQKSEPELKKNLKIETTENISGIKKNNQKIKTAKAAEKIDTADLVGTARRRVSQRISKSGAEKLQKLNRTTISLSENNEEYVMNRCEETGASITVTINKIIQEYREIKGIK